MWMDGWKIPPLQDYPGSSELQANGIGLCALNSRLSTGLPSGKRNINHLSISAPKKWGGLGLAVGPQLTVISTLKVPIRWPE